MADAEQLFKDVEISDEIKSTILTRVETLENEHKSKLDEAIQTRQAAKSKLSEIETKYAEMQDKFSKGDFDGKSVLEEQLSKLKMANESITKEKSKLEQDVQSLSGRVDALSTSTKKMLETYFKPEKWETVKDLDIEVIRNLAQFEEKHPAGVDKGKNNDFKDPDKELTSEEKMAKLYAKAN